MTRVSKLTALNWCKQKICYFSQLPEWKWPGLQTEEMSFFIFLEPLPRDDLPTFMLSLTMGSQFPVVSYGAELIAATLISWWIIPCLAWLELQCTWQQPPCWNWTVGRCCKKDNFLLYYETSPLLSFFFFFPLIILESEEKRAKSITKKQNFYRLNQINYAQKSTTVTTVLVAVQFKELFIFYHPLASYSTLLPSNISSILSDIEFVICTYNFLHFLLGFTHCSLSSNVIVEDTQLSVLHYFLYCYSSLWCLSPEWLSWYFLWVDFLLCFVFVHQNLITFSLSLLVYHVETLGNMFSPLVSKMIFAKIFQQNMLPVSMEERVFPLRTLA